MSQSAAAGLQDTHDAAHDEHSSFIKTPQQLALALLLGFLVPIIGVMLTVHLVLGSQAPSPETLEPKAIAARLQPVGRVEVVDANAPKVFRASEEIVKTVCSACHIPGVANAPKIGDKAAWGKLAKGGLDRLTQEVIKGKGAMPPRAGVPDLSDFELARAIVYMANQSGASMKEPAPSADGSLAAPAKADAKTPAKADAKAPAKADAKAPAKAADKK